MTDQPAAPETEHALHFDPDCEECAYLARPTRETLAAQPAAPETAEKIAAEYARLMEPAPPDALSAFAEASQDAMLTRLRDGERRGWGTSWREDYPDADVVLRLGRAVYHLRTALVNYRTSIVGEDELRKRAADVANQAFMLADPVRLTESAPQREPCASCDESHDIDYHDHHWHPQDATTYIGEAHPAQPAAPETERLREALRAMVAKWAPHSGNCCTFDENGKVIVTPESCVCPPMHKEARAAIEAGDES